MSTTWWSMNKKIGLGDIDKVNNKLNASRAWEEEDKVQPIKVTKDLLQNTFWLERTDTAGEHHALEILDFDERRGCWSEMKRWGMNGGNGSGEAILRPLLESDFKLVSEYNEQHYVNRARAEEMKLRAGNDNHNKLKFSRKQDRIKAGISGN